MNQPSTSDVHDACINNPECQLQVARPGLMSFGGQQLYHGEITTVAASNGAPLRLRDRLTEPGHQRVLVVEGYGQAAEWALLGDKLSQLALDNGWSGIVLNGYVRDVATLRNIPLGVHALGSIPSRPQWPEYIPVMRDIPLVFQGVRFHPGQWLYADKDGIVVVAQRITA
ncbi:ribonuclease E activity regulator RraA [Herbaspirillum sp. GCM10030257]|uniref:ribonuclease E activity regulator RraA n=1 Tax=Herbaspirillum sp. GCM10030257 TaxID=3273393 RepID=UPI003610B896